MEKKISGIHAAMASLRLAHLLTVAMVSLQPVMAWADEDADIVVSCHFLSGEFGYEAIDMCVKENRAARMEVSRYPEGVGSIVDRCSRSWEPAWVMVKRCVDEDVAAAAALEALARDHRLKVDRCWDEFSGLGETRVKACVEQAIAAENPGGGQKGSEQRQE